MTSEWFPFQGLCGHTESYDEVSKTFIVILWSADRRGEKDRQKRAVQRDREKHTISLSSSTEWEAKRFCP